MSAELQKSERARLMSELDEFFPEVKHSEREMHLLDENQQLESRIAALTEDRDEQCRLRDRAERDLATERAAREKAEKALQQQGKDLRKARDDEQYWREQAERERDTALARVEELEEYISRAPSGHEQRLIREAEGAVTLEKARHEETRAALRYAQEKREAAESALASARELRYETLSAVQSVADKWHRFGDSGARQFADEISAVIVATADTASHPSPAPVAAHCQECVELGACPAEAERLFEESSGDDEPEEDTESLIEQLDEALCSLLHTGGEIGEHSPRTHLDLFYAKQAESPVAAPCAGCTSARTAITEALRLYAGGHEHGDVLRAWLADASGKAELARRAARKESKP